MRHSLDERLVLSLDIALQSQVPAESLPRVLHFIGLVEVNFPYVRKDVLSFYRESGNLVVWVNGYRYQRSELSGMDSYV